MLGLHACIPDAQRMLNAEWQTNARPKRIYGQVRKAKRNVRNGVNFNSINSTRTQPSATVPSAHVSRIKIKDLFEFKSCTIATAAAIDFVEYDVGERETESEKGQREGERREEREREGGRGAEWERGRERERK